MHELGVDYAVLSEKLDRLSGITVSISEEIGKIAQRVAQLDIFWDGDANSAYITKIGEDLLDADVIVMNIRNTVRAAVKTMDLYQKNEKEIKRMIGDFKL